ncbi:MAG: hypothetical protein JRI63_01660 [Deltaproteobacteria bacterium]|nr:hypothetical protein [Deltaproteobacteria bacterium]MBW1957234.1 hypothetical protein [Deltaproteobacteria bacterium]MBW2012342.1 hypothetical protein [Deltaproteobacteria bacterium]MBW2087756.1 hypothetical protein [Deltaproteobacteria bacterium]
MEDKDTKSQADIEWEQRKLCKDESCIGVIGPDGRCKECGLPFEEGPSDEIKAEPSIENLKETEPEDELEEDAESGEEKSDLDLEWEQRKLCIDESCIGVIGPDGRCKECGKPYESE